MEAWWWGQRPENCTYFPIIWYWSSSAKKYKELGPIPNDPPDPDSVTPEEYDKYVSEQIKILLGDKEFIATFKRERPIVISNDNPLLGTSVYEVELPDGANEELDANAISENLWAQCYEDGFMCQILDKIVYHCINGQAIITDNAYIDNPSVKISVKLRLVGSCAANVGMEKPLG